MRAARVALLGSTLGAAAMFLRTVQVLVSDGAVYRKGSDILLLTLEDFLREGKRNLHDTQQYPYSGMQTSSSESENATTSRKIAEASQGLMEINPAAAAHSHSPPTDVLSGYIKKEKIINQLHQQDLNQKNNHLNNNHSTEMILLFVHIGKAGGETIKSILKYGCLVRRNKRVRKQCLDRLPHPETALSKAVRGYYHCFTMAPSFQFAGRPDTTAFLVNIRHPVERALSWYRYIHPENCMMLGNKLNRKKIQYQSSPACIARAEQEKDPEASWVARFFRCAPTAHDFALLGRRGGGGGGEMATDRRWLKQEGVGTTQSYSNVSMPFSEQMNDISCIDMISAVLAGTVDWRKHTLAAHMAANYHDYYTNTVGQHPNKPVFVVRTESMWQDLKVINQMLDGRSIDLSATVTAGHTGTRNESNTRESDNFTDSNVFGQLEGSKVSHGSENFRKLDESLSFQAYQGLCCALRAELLLYKDLIDRAVNIAGEKDEGEFQNISKGRNNPDLSLSRNSTHTLSKEQTWNEALALCGVSTWIELETACS